MACETGEGSATAASQKVLSESISKQINVQNNEEVLPSAKAAAERMKNSLDKAEEMLKQANYAVPGRTKTSFCMCNDLSLHPRNFRVLPDQCSQGFGANCTICAYASTLNGHGRFEPGCSNWASTWRPQSKSSPGNVG